MFESIMNFFKKFGKQDKTVVHSKDAAKERLHLVLMQDRANVSADFLDLMKQEIIEVIKKYIDVDENEIDVRLANKTNEDGTTGAPALYANIPIISIKEEAKKEVSKQESQEKKENEEKQTETKTDEDMIEETPKEQEEVKENTSNISETDESKEEQKVEELKEEKKENNDNEEDTVEAK